VSKIHPHTTIKTIN